MGDGGCFIQRVERDRKEELDMKARELRPGACYWYTGRGRREMLRYRYRELDVYLFDSDDGQSVRLTAERVERYIQGRA